MTEGESTPLVKSDKSDAVYSLNLPKRVGIQNLGDPSRIPFYARFFLTQNNWNKYTEKDMFILENESIHNKYIYLSKKDFSLKFFKKQVEFLSSLSSNEILLLQSYTYKGDRIVNAISKNPYNDDITTNYFLNTYSKNRRFINHLKYILEFNEPVTRENIFKFFTIYSTKLLLIFNKAPAFEKEVRLFRGLHFKKDKPVKIEPFSGIVSTSYIPRKADDFAGSNCCILDIKVKPGVKAIWLSPISSFSMNFFGLITTSENEVALFCPNVKTEIKTPPTEKHILVDDNNYHSQSITTYDVIVEPIKFAGNKHSRKTKRIRRKTRRSASKLV